MGYDRTFVIFGEPASKANSRRLVTIGGRPSSIKSKKALDYIVQFQSQLQRQTNGMLAEGDLRVEMVIHYATRRPDLDESVILDAMQKIVYANDRQVKQREVYWALDRDLPRAVIRVMSCDIQAIPLHLRDDPVVD